ncbi:beta-lactamase family protein [Crossiella sp. SN42]|uniref:serine hydrolase domain-containing protein n=1 Tax=Crossiella sp. SN42 TaxID=2944808 RepID=UPI00207CE610|nr:serine hydrolase domain-containing protein [Crossiella sp. SN42]MCO1582594.1 beta-lactamase family protein [Crossiella sp. SN42]
MHTTTALQQVLDRAVSEGGVPGILAETRRHGGVWFGTAGVADTSTGGKRLPEHRFRIGSTTKTFVATVLLQLAAEGLLGLDDTVERWLPGLVRNGSAITLRQLLNHTSGVFSHTDDQPALSAKEGYTPTELVAVSMAHAPLYSPGAGWNYSNTNYVLAGLVIEQATGHTLAEQLTSRITAPLALTGTYQPSPADHTIRGPHSRHYTKLFQPDLSAPTHDATELDHTPFWASGDMISTAADLTRFFHALLTGDLLPPAWQRELLTTVPTENWIPHAAYGLGISSIQLPGGTVWGMGGAIFGSWSYTYGSRDGTHVVAVNINGDWANTADTSPLSILTEAISAEFPAPSPGSTG